MKQELEEGVLDGWWGPQAPKADGRLTSCVALGKYPWSSCALVSPPLRGDGQSTYSRDCCGLK